MLAWLRNYRRRRILRLHTIDDELWQQVVAELEILAGIAADDLTRLRELATLFLFQKRFFGTHGLVVDEYMKVAIAAQACLPILNLGIEYYRGWYTVILYPETFVARHEYHDDIGVVHEGVGELDGESVEGGPIVLSWAEAAPGSHAPGEGSSVVVHEFAHKLDYLTGVTNGLPPLHPGMSVAEWSRVMTAAFEAFVEMADAGTAAQQLAGTAALPLAGNAALPLAGNAALPLAGDALPFDDYAAEDPGEFFAVMSEYFFEAPGRLIEVFPEVYEQLKRFYRQDPAVRLS